MLEQQENPEERPGRLARRLIRSAHRATLATWLSQNGETWPYASLVLTACAPDGTPLLLLSDLADHSRNIAADARVALLFDGTVGLEEPLTGPRFTLLGRARETHHPGDRARYLAHHPTAARYADFKDFRFYRVEPTRGHLVAGFGRIHWLAAHDFLFATDEADDILVAEGDILAHMNSDHADAVNHYARCLLGRDGENWVMTGIDPEGIDLRSGGHTARLEFSRPILSRAAARAELARLACEGHP
ncbi:MAG TPA: DUF2470 domain-containing protein [Alphaproteobacteria bacterium]|nr:DUF2470 domain-containing protein [Alphaproteobacteria bacterium]